MEELQVRLFSIFTIQLLFSTCLDLLEAGQIFSVALFLIPSDLCSANSSNCEGIQGSIEAFITNSISTPGKILLSG